MKPLPFENPSARRVYEAYFNRVRKQVTILSPNDRDDILMELNSHIFESMAGNSDPDEVNRLLNALEHLGEPEDFLKPLVAEKKAKQAGRTFNPKYVAQALWLNMTNGFFYAGLALLYLFQAAFAMLVFAKLLTPDKTGLFLNGDWLVAYGMVDDPEQYREVLGHGFIPVTLLLVASFYMATTWLLRLKSSK